MIMSLYLRVRRKIKKSRPEMQTALKCSRELLHARENRGKQYSLKELVKLWELCKQNGVSLTEFWDLVEKSARND